MAKARRVSKHEWLEAALELLSSHGVESLSVERLAREIGTSKSGFYWHFRDRTELVDAIIEYWSHEFTEIVANNPQMREGDPVERLERLACMILDHDLTQFDPTMLAWAEADKAIMRKVRRVYRNRLDFLTAIFREVGFKGEELELRARLFTCYHTWERPMFNSISKTRLRAMIKRRVRLLTTK